MLPIPGLLVSYAGILLAGAIPGPDLSAISRRPHRGYAARQSAILNNAEVCLLLTFHRAERRQMAASRVRSLTGVVDAEKLIDAADKAPPPSPGAPPLHVTGSRVRRAATSRACSTPPVHG